MSNKDMLILSLVMTIAAIFYGAVTQRRENERRSAEYFASYGEVITVYNSDGALIGVMWTPDEDTSLEYIPGKDGVPRFVARREAKSTDVLSPAAFEDTVRQ